MNYFTFSQILIGMLSFVLGGCFTALITESIKLLLSFKNEFPRLARHLYKNRFFFFGRKIIFAKQKSNRLDDAITDFLCVILLFVVYVAVSYLCFDGIFRFVYFLLLLISYFLCVKYLLRPYSFILIRAAHFLLHTVSFIIAPWIFLLCKLLFVLNLPIRGIIFLLRSLILISLSKKRTHNMIKKAAAASKKMFEAAI